MMFSVYAIRDVLQDYGNSLYIFPNEEVAKRWFGQVVSTSVLPKDRVDLELWYIGSFNNETGEFLKNNLRERIMIGSEVEL